MISVHIAVVIPFLVALVFSWVGYYRHVKFINSLGKAVNELNESKNKAVCGINYAIGEVAERTSKLEESLKVGSEKFLLILPAYESEHTKNSSRPTVTEVVTALLSALDMEIEQMPGIKPAVVVKKKIVCADHSPEAVEITEADKQFSEMWGVEAVHFAIFREGITAAVLAAVKKKKSRKPAERKTK